jgi:hypothetical protein
MLNPWVRTETGHSKALYSHYYSQRIFSGEFWGSLFSGKFRPVRSARDLLKHLWRIGGGEARRPSAAGACQAVDKPLPLRLAQAWQEFKGSTLLVLAGQDLVATEFKNAAHRAPLSKALQNPLVSTVEMADATHTFSSRAWRERVATETIGFAKSLA